MRSLFLVIGEAQSGFGVREGAIGVFGMREGVARSLFGDEREGAIGLLNF
ncbi:hypothetical protein [Halothece sp. PCC 7418]|nr:hypothetical protein [Halothece sp. PCC 7418]